MDVHGTRCRHQSAARIDGRPDPQAPAGIEVFLVRRHGDIAFMGGAHVFPGGRVEESDGDERLRCAPTGASREGTHGR